MKKILLPLLLSTLAFADSYIVEFKKELTQKEMSSLDHIVSKNKIKKFTQYESSYFNRLYQIELSSSERTLLQKNELVKLIEKDFEAQYFEIRVNPNSEMIVDDLLFPQQWGLYNQGQVVETRTLGGKKRVVEASPGVDINWKDAIDDIEKNLKKYPVVAVVDMGIDFEHKDLKDQIYRNTLECDDDLAPFTTEEDRDGNKFPSDCHGWNFAATAPEEMRYPFDDKGHGTHVSGIIAAKRNNELGIGGVSDKIKILPVRVTGSIDETSDKYRIMLRSPSQRIANGILYAIKMNVDVINLSLGWPKSMDTNFMRNVIAEATSKDIIVVAAAGNDNSNQGVYPCNYHDVICVGSVDIDGNMSTFSNYGGQVDILAPGDQIVSTIPEKFIPLKLNIQGYDILTGTSQAAPFVSATAALLKGSYPEITSDDLKNRLYNSAREKLQPEKSLHGLLNLKDSFQPVPSQSVKPIFKELIEGIVDPRNGRVRFPVFIKNYGDSNAKAEIKIESLVSHIDVVAVENEHKTFEAGKPSPVFINAQVKDFRKDRQFKFKVTVSDAQGVKEYFHEISLGLDIRKLPFREYGFKFTKEIKPIIYQDKNTKDYRDNLNTIDEPILNGELPSYFLLQNKDQQTRISIFNFDGRGFAEAANVLEIDNVVKFLGIQKHDYNYDGKKDIFVMTIHCEGESCGTRNLKEEDLYLKFTYRNTDLEPLFKGQSEFILRKTEGVSYDLSSTRFYKHQLNTGETIALPFFIAQGLVPKVNVEKGHDITPEEKIDVFSDSHSIGDFLLNQFRPDEKKSLRRIYRYEIANNELRLRSFVDDDFFNLVKLKMERVLNKRIDIEDANVNIVHLMQQSQSDFEADRVRGIISFGLGVYQYNVKIEIHDKKFSLKAMDSVSQPLLGNSQYKSFDLSGDQLSFGDAFVYFTTSHLLTVTGVDQNEKETAIPYRLEKANDLIMGFVGYFTHPNHNELIFEQVDSLALVKQVTNERHEVYESKTNKFSFLPGAMMTETFFPIVMDNQVDNKLDSGIYIDNTAISSNQIYIKTMNDRKFISPIKNSLILTPNCKSKNPVMMEQGFFGYTLLCLESNGYRLKYLPFQK
ncbi:MAG: hypothetical protein CME62_04025 [Halobacteriovoraceae bacterium]|nr:hypothetical protein [Halobacteriovoraceae bacterium]|tara:strand:+ start:3404 stop:6685 length:3282 start_codon:yes stop_codon:yes gene_type:complete